MTDAEMLAEIRRHLGEVCRHAVLRRGCEPCDLADEVVELRMEIVDLKSLACAPGALVSLAAERDALRAQVAAYQQPDALVPARMLADALAERAELIEALRLSAIDNECWHAEVERWRNNATNLSVEVDDLRMRLPGLPL